MSEQMKCPMEGFDKFIKSQIIPRCFFCGNQYEIDEAHCNDKFNVFKPICECINKPTIRIVVDK